MARRKKQSGQVKQGQPKVEQAPKTESKSSLENVTLTWAEQKRKAKELGMGVTNTTTKSEIEAFLVSKEGASPAIHDAAITDTKGSIAVKQGEAKTVHVEAKKVEKVDKPQEAPKFPSMESLLNEAPEVVDPTESNITINVNQVSAPKKSASEVINDELKLTGDANISAIKGHWRHMSVNEINELLSRDSSFDQRIVQNPENDKQAQIVLIKHGVEMKFPENGWINIA